MPRNHDSPGDTVVTLLLCVTLLGLALGWYRWSSLERLTADATTDRGALWLPASDVAPGDVLDGHVELRAGLKVAIAGVVVNGAGAEQLIGGRQPGWGDRIETRWLAPEEGRDQFDFQVRVPAEARPGEVLRLEISVEYVAAEHHGYDQFTDRWHAERFRLDVPIHSKTASVLRRVGKAGLALATWVAVVAFLVGCSRWYRRRGRAPSAAWLVLLAPHALLGWAWFSTLLEHATRLHGGWMVALYLLVWYLALAAGLWLVARHAVARYAVVQTRLPTVAGDAYRGGAPVPSVELAAMVEAWRAAGFVVEPQGDALDVAHFQGGRARVRVPASQRFGAGAPFEIHTADRATALALISAAAALLGELRWQLATAAEQAPEAAVAS